MRRKKPGRIKCKPGYYLPKGGAVCRKIKINNLHESIGPSVLPALGTVAAINVGVGLAGYGIKEAGKEYKKHIEKKRIEALGQEYKLTEKEAKAHIKWEKEQVKVVFDKTKTYIKSMLNKGFKERTNKYVADLEVVKKNLEDQEEKLENIKRTRSQKK